MVLPTVDVSLRISVNALKIIPHRCVWRLASKVIPDPVKLTKLITTTPNTIHAPKKPKQTKQNTKHLKLTFKIYFYLCVCVCVPLWRPEEGIRFPGAIVIVDNCELPDKN